MDSAATDDVHQPLPLVHSDAADVEISAVVDFGAVPKWFNYTVLSRERLGLRIEGLIAQVSTALSVPRLESTVLLLRFRWHVKNLIDAWRSDYGQIRENLTFLMETQPVFDSSQQKDLLISSYVENNWNIKWCPSPGCEHAAESLDDGAVLDVSCLCSNTFCWNCASEAHRPVNCTTVKKWAAEIAPETQSMNQILLWFKPCPKCKQPIDIGSESEGRFILCPSPCNHQFCWSCLEGWEFHDLLGDCLIPNNETVKEAGALLSSALRYFRYLERWEAYEASEERAVAALEKVKNESGIDFLVGAWEVIRNCRRVLKWRHVLLYFLPGDDKCNKEKDKLWRIEAEKALRKLHSHVRKCSVEMLQDNGRSEEFHQLRRTIIELTIRAKGCFENLVYAIEKQGPEVNGESLVHEKVLKKSLHLKNE